MQLQRQDFPIWNQSIRLLNSVKAASFKINLDLVSRKRVKMLVIAGFGFGSLLLAGCAQKQQVNAQPQADSQTQKPVNNVQLPSEKDVPYVPTPTVVVDEMLKQAKVTGKDVLYDLGSGDGRIVITAAKKFGTKGIGIEIDPDLLRKSQENAQKEGVSDRVKFLQQDFFKTDLREATVVTLYLLPDINLKLRPKLLSELKPGTRVVSHNYHMGDWKPERVVQIKAPGAEHYVFYWVVPEKTPENVQK